MLQQREQPVHGADEEARDDGLEYGQHGC
jgi:hypothetical protein